MLARLFTTLTLVTLTVTLLPGCDAGAVADEPTELRAVTITDKWGEHEPVSFPDLNSCEDYWNNTPGCADAGSAACSYMHARYSCSSSSGVVVVTDNFFSEGVSTAIWRVHGPSFDGFSPPAESPLAACALLKGPKAQKACKPLAQLAGLANELGAIAPEGGIAPVLAVDEIDETLPLFADNALMTILDATDWTLPALPYAARVLLGEQSSIIEDNVVYLLAPNGTTTVAGTGIILHRDTRCTMDKLELCVDVDVK